MGTMKAITNPISIRIKAIPFPPMKILTQCSFLWSLALEVLIPDDQKAIPLTIWAEIQ